MAYPYIEMVNEDAGGSIMYLNKYLDINPEVAEAVAQGRPVVAL